METDENKNFVTREEEDTMDAVATLSRYGNPLFTISECSIMAAAGILFFQINLHCSEASPPSGSTD